MSGPHHISVPSALLSRLDRRSFLLSQHKFTENPIFQASSTSKDTSNMVVQKLIKQAYINIPALERLLESRFGVGKFEIKVRITYV